MVFVAVGVLMVVVAWLGSRRRRLRPRELEAPAGPAACGTCGYDVRGLPGDICPECGSDLRVVGRMTPSFRRWQKVPPLARGVFWTTLLVFVGGILGVLAMLDAVPHEYSLVDSSRYATRTLATAEGGPIVVEATSTWRARYPSGTARLGDWPLGPSKTLEQGWTIRFTEAFPRSGTNRLVHATLQIDRLNRRWNVDAEGVVRSGEGTPAPQVILEVLRLSMKKPRVGAPTPAELRAIVAFWFSFVDAPESYEPEAQRRKALTLLPEEWKPFLPEEATDLTTNGRSSELGWVGAIGGSEHWRADRGVIALAASFWLLVWLIGLRFTGRRRAVRVRRTPRSAAIDENYYIPEQ